MKKDKKRNRLKKRQKDQWRISWSSSNIRYLIIFWRYLLTEQIVTTEYHFVGYECFNP